MTFRLMIRSRPSGDLVEKHKRLMSCLSHLTNEWGLKDAEWPQAKDPRTNPALHMTLTKYFHRGIKASVSYQNRKHVEDHGMYDDHLELKFTPEKVNYALLVNECFEHYIEWFDAYVGEIGDMECDHLDMKAWEASDTDGGRSSVFRIHPVCFFDKELCARSFGLTPEAIAKRVSKEVERVTVRPNGVVIIASSKILTLEEADHVNETRKALLSC